MRLFNLVMVVLVLVFVLAAFIAWQNGTGATGVVDTLRGMFNQLVSIFNQLPH